MLGNPDVKPEKTVQYEIGYKQVINDDLGVDVTVFYKDIRDLLGVEFIETYNGAEYARLTNVDFGNVVGFTLALDHRRLGPVSVALDYTWQQALGNSSDPRETADAGRGRRGPAAAAGPLQLGPAPHPQPDRGAGQAGRLLGQRGAAGGQRPALHAGDRVGLRRRAGDQLGPQAGRLPGRPARRRRPSAWPAGAGVFVRVFNLFDTRYFNGAVFASTGSPYYSRFPAADGVALADPTRFYRPAPDRDRRCG